MTFSPDTIAAIATAISHGEGGIAIIRISGSAALKSCKKIVSIKGKQTWESHSVNYGHVIDPTDKECLDEVLIIFMKSPRSFTGEDIVEIHCHGGLIAVQRVFERVLSQPDIRRALPGEFSQRAVLNGKLDLTQAEAINELISARSEKAAKLAISGINGHTKSKIGNIREKLLDCLSELEARVDFEDELPPLDSSKLILELQAIRSELEVLIEDSSRSKFFRQGVKVALIGCPNVGKSSLLNKLSRRDRAIVTDLPGTTRDILESEVIIEGMPITLIDTAGIRETDDKVEKFGIERSHQTIVDADVIIMIFDTTIGWTNKDSQLFSTLPSIIPKIIVGNKIDLKIYSKPIQISTKDYPFMPIVFLSAHTGEGEQELIDSLLKACGASQTTNLSIALNARQQDLASLAVDALARLNEVAEHELPWDFWTIDLRTAIKNLGEITGNEITESLLERIFSKFCIGK